MIDPSAAPPTWLRDLQFVAAQLRHTYQQLIAPSAQRWDHEQRIALADGLLSPQIKRLESVVAACPPPSAAPCTNCSHVDPHEAGDRGPETCGHPLCRCDYDSRVFRSL